MVNKVDRDQDHIHKDGVVSKRLQSMYQAIDDYNCLDPITETTQDGEQPRALLYGQRMSLWLQKRAPDAGEPVQISVRAQHIGRWELARQEYPDGRQGYKQWRRQQAARHAQITTDLMQPLGYSQQDTQRVASILRKEKLGTDKDVQVLEDVACLVFLTYYFDAFASKHEEEKIISIVRKTWNKMTEQGKELTKGIPFSESSQGLIGQALY